MNECSFLSLNYSNMSRLFMYKCGAGKLIVEESSLSFIFKKAWTPSIEIAKNEVFIKKISSKKIRIFNKKYKYLYFFVDDADKTINILKMFGYIDNITEFKKNTCTLAKHKILFRKNFNLEYQNAEMIVDSQIITIKSFCDIYCFKATETIITILDAEIFEIKSKNMKIKVSCMPNALVINSLKQYNFCIQKYQNIAEQPRELEKKIFICVLFFLFFIQILFFIICNILL